MPIREIMAFAYGIIGTLAVTHPFHLQEEMRKLEIQILHETARTDTWGNPSIFVGHTHRRIRAVDRLRPVRPFSFKEDLGTPSP
jgi:hypothetical protein